MLDASPKSRSQVSHFDALIIAIGYAGYIPGVKSENCFGTTYGRTTYESSAGTIPRGIDLPNHVKYNTTMKQEFTKRNP